MIRLTNYALLAGAVLFSPLALAAGYAPTSSQQLVASSTTSSSSAPIGSQPAPTLHEQDEDAYYTHDGDETDPPDDESGDPDNGNPSSPVPDPGEGSTDPVASGDSIVQVKIQTTGAGPGRMVTFGQVFKKGAVSADRTVVASLDGQTLPTQVDRKASWADESLRHAVITVRLPERPRHSSPVTLNLEAASSPSASAAPVRIDDLLASGFQGKITFLGSHGQRSADARSLLSAASGTGCPAWGQQCKQWLDGPLVSEWVVGGPVAGGDDPSHLAVYFNVRAYRDASGAVSRARVDTVVENDWAYTSNPHNLHYLAHLRIGDGLADSIQPLTHYTQARWHQVEWWGGNPDLYAQVDTNYLQATGAISKYADLSPDASTLNRLDQHYPPMTSGDQTVYMAQTGAQAGIGPLPRWSSLYAVSGDRHAFGYMLANDSAAGTYGFHYRDRETGRPLKITDHPYVTILNYRYASGAGGKLKRDLLPDCDSDCHSPVSFDTAHQPSIGYLSYLVTGDFYYLEEMQFAASYNELQPNEGYRKYDKGILRKAHGQIRDQAWSLRSISDAAFATPDSDPMKSYFTGVMKNIFDDYNSHYVGTDVSPLHILTNNIALAYSNNNRERTGIAPWQTDFFTWAVGHSVDQHMPGAKKFLNWLSTWQIGRATGWLADRDRGYCWLQASAYSLQVRDTQDSPFYRTLDDVYANNYQRELGLACNSDAMRLRLSSDANENIHADQMVGYAESPTGFPANYQVGLAAAVDSDVKNGDRAWSIFEGRSHKPDYADYPNFAVVPRSVDTND